MAHGVVCISRVTAAGGEAIGHAVAERLSYRYVDDEVITYTGLTTKNSSGREAFTGITVDLSDPIVRPRKLAWIAGAVERRSLARPR